MKKIIILTNLFLLINLFLVNAETKNVEVSENEQFTIEHGYTYNLKHGDNIYILNAVYLMVGSDWIQMDVNYKDKRYPFGRYMSQIIFDDNTILKIDNMDSDSQKVTFHFEGSPRICGNQECEYGENSENCLEDCGKLPDSKFVFCEDFDLIPRGSNRNFLTCNAGWEDVSSTVALLDNQFLILRKDNALIFTPDPESGDLLRIVGSFLKADVWLNAAQDFEGDMVYGDTSILTI